MIKTITCTGAEDCQVPHNIWLVKSAARGKVVRPLFLRSRYDRTHNDYIGIAAAEKEQWAAQLYVERTSAVREAAAA